MLPLDSESQKSPTASVVPVGSGQSGAVGKDKVGLWRKRIGTGFMLAVIFGMGFLLLRENEGRTAAEEKLKQAQQGIDAMMAEKNNTIDELQSQIDELTGKYSELTEQYNAMVAEKDGEITKGNEEREKQAAAHRDEITLKDSNYKDLETRAKNESQKLNEKIESKSAEISDLGSQIQSLSTKYSEVLSKKRGVGER
jgi:chromosome segregation ATPase